MVWDATVTSVTLGGGAAGNVSTTLLPYENGNKTAVLDVTGNFAVSDVITVVGLTFTTFSGASAADSLELELENDGVVSAEDDKTIEITTDATPPDAVSDLATGTVTATSVQLSWTAPGDDGATGTATTYDIRYSTSTITEGNWASATQANGEPSPQVAGSSESFTVTGLPASTTHYFVIKTSDEVPNESAISNVPSVATSASVGTILLVVPNAASLTAQDSVKKALMESWDYSVVLISANDTQGNFDAAVATSDAAYVSEEVSSSDVSTKLTSATIGVVLEEGALSDEIGFSSGKLNYTDSAIDITDNTHYITSVFSTGSLTITSSAQSLHYLDGTIAAGAQVLAEQLATANRTLVVLDVGAALDPAGTAAGRRVLLPWGPDAFDINSLTVDGQTLMLRAIEWAAGASSNSTPTVASAIPDTTVVENSPAVDNYRDLKAVFTDVEDGSGLTFTIQGNTNPGLVTPTIVAADSTLDLSFTASTTGTATITIRATDSGALFVDDVFVVNVNPPAALLGRYWLNEAPSGQAPTTVFDDQASPLNLSVTYDANLAWTLDNGHRGLGSSIVHGGIAKATAAGTKYTTNLNGATQATFVVVMEWGAGNADRIAGFQQTDGTRTVQLMTKTGGDLEFRYDGIVENPRLFWPGTWDDGVRRVFHLVYDSDHPTLNDRVRLYVDGVDQGTPSITSGALPPLGDGLDFSDPTIELAVTNESDLSNGLPGTVFYYAVYDGAMTDSEILTDRTALLADDDNITYTVAVTPDGVDTLKVLPSNGTAYSYRLTINNSSSVIEDFDLFGFPGDVAVLTVDSILGPSVTQGAAPDSALITGIPATTSDSAFVWYSVANVAAGTLDSIYVEARSYSSSTVADSGWVFIEVAKPNLTTGKAVNPSGTQLPGTDLTYTVTITNDGNYDATGVVIVDSLAVELDFKVGSVVNNLPAGVTATVEYSNDAGSSWTYVPVSAGCGAPATYDSCLTHIRWTLDNDLSYVGPDNTGNVEFVARIQ